MFRFDLGDRVNVPHFVNVQGQVVELSNSILNGRRYGVSWLSGIATTTRSFSEAEMADANAPAVTAHPSAAADIDPPANKIIVKIGADTSELDKALKKTKRLVMAVRRASTRRKLSRKAKR